MDSDDDPLVSYHVNPITIPVELTVPSLGAMAVLDLGCTRCVVSPEVVEKLGLRFRQLMVPIAFCQLDRTVAQGVLTHFAMELVELWMGNHQDYGMPGGIGETQMAVCGGTSLKALVFLRACLVCAAPGSLVKVPFL